MSECPEENEPTEADLDMLVEEITGKPTKPADFAAGIASMRHRIVELEAAKSKLLAQLDSATADREAHLNVSLASTNKDLATARERLAHYQAQLGQQN